MWKYGGLQGPILDYEMLNGLDLFSGIGGITKALEGYVRPVAYCEQDRYCQGVLLSRMSTGDIARAAIWDDVQTLRGKQLPEVDIIYGGFPCQDISIAGAGKGLEGKRSGLFSEITRLVDEVQPSFIFLENVPAITTRGLAEVTAEITKRGYDSRWTVISASEVGAPHVRKRWWLLANTNSPGCEEQRRTLAAAQKYSTTKCANQWAAEPDVGRVADGIPARVDRLRGLGNAVVPLQARVAFEALIGLDGIGGING